MGLLDPAVKCYKLSGEGGLEHSSCFHRKKGNDSKGNRSTSCSNQECTTGMVTPAPFIPAPCLSTRVEQHTVIKKDRKNKQAPPGDFEAIAISPNPTGGSGQGKIEMIFCPFEGL